MSDILLQSRWIEIATVLALQTSLCCRAASFLRSTQCKKISVPKKVTKQTLQIQMNL